MIGRRPFLLGSVGLATTPVFAHLAPPFAVAPSPQAAGGLPAATALANRADPQDLVLGIHGWDLPGDASVAAPGQAWVHINSSWRAAWR